MSEMSDHQRIALVDAMFEAWEDLDFDRAASLFSEDGVLRSIPSEPHVGRKAIAERFESHKVNITEANFLDRTIGVIDGRVFAQRVDEFVFQGVRIKVPVVGVFRTSNGLITEWLEYVDQETVRLAKSAGQVDS